MIAIAHALAILIWKTLATGVPYREPGEQNLDERKRQRLIRHYVRRLGRLGVRVCSLRTEPTRYNRTRSGTTVLAPKQEIPNKPTGAQARRLRPPLTPARMLASHARFRSPALR